MHYTTNEEESFARVVRECQKWDVAVTINAHVDTSGHPKQVGAECYLAWPEPVIWCTVRVPKAHEVLHELAHLVVGDYPETVDEHSSGMLAFEYHTTRRLKLGQAWNRRMHGYTIVLPDMSTVVDWHKATTRQRSAELRASLPGALRRGVLQLEGSRVVPTYVRRQPELAP